MKALPLLFFLLAQADWMQPGENQPVSPVAFSGREFVEAFNAAADRPRLVLIFSPTCPHCLRGALETRQILQKMPEARVKVMVLWSPILRRDNKLSAEAASAYLDDPRVDHYWDLWSFGLRTYTELLRYPPNERAWDIFILYEAGIGWEGTPPQPTVWMQHRNLSHGTNYQQNLLETELRRLLAEAE